LENARKTWNKVRIRCQF